MTLGNIMMPRITILNTKTLSIIRLSTMMFKIKATFWITTLIKLLWIKKLRITIIRKYLFPE
jgi:hypothetical protein